MRTTKSEPEFSHAFYNYLKDWSSWAIQRHVAIIMGRCGGYFMVISTHTVVFQNIMFGHLPDLIAPLQPVHFRLSIQRTPSLSWSTTWIILSGFSSMNIVRQTPYSGTCSTKSQKIFLKLSPPPLALRREFDSFTFISSLRVYSSALSPRYTVPLN